MQRIALALLCPLSAFVPAAAANAGSIAAVQRVIQMLQDMSATTKKEKNDEQVAFAEFSTWCTNEQARLKNAIAGNTESIGMLTAEIDKLSADIQAHGESIANLDNGIASNEANVKAEQDQRAKDNAAFLEESQDFSESVDALDRAIAILKKQDYDRPAGAAALLQLSESERIPDKVKSLVTTFLGMVAKDGDSPLGGMDYAAPQANAYEFQSTSLVEMLKKLQDQFREKLAESQKAEMNSKHASAMILQDLQDDTENKKKEKEETTTIKERKTETRAQDKKDLADTETQKAANDQTLKEVTTECTEKAFSFQEKQNLRTEELEAIAKAIEVLSSPDVLGNAEKHLALAQVRRATALVQGGVRGASSAVQKAAGIRRRLREFLEGEGQRLHSERLTLLAEKMGADPFAKVKKMIDAMITRLLEEANADAQHEGFCDTEMGKSKITRNKLTEDIDALQAACDSGKSTILRVTETISTLSQEVADLDTAMQVSTEQRTAESKTNAATVADAQAAQKAVAAAVAVLKDFYAKASTATAFVQLRAAPEREWGLKQTVKMGSDEWNALANPNFEGRVDTGHKEGMQTFGETEFGKQDEAQYGVLGLLEVIASDFANLEADTNAAEAAAAEAYERFMAESKKNKAVKTKSIEMNTADRAAAEAQLTTDTADLKATQDELLAAERYYEKLAPQCIDNGMTFEERTAARAAEIASLKEALKILSSEDIA